MLHIIIVSWIIQVTSPMCTIRTHPTCSYRPTLVFDCNNVSNEFMVKWNFENRCETRSFSLNNYDDRSCYALNITNSNFIFINKILTGLITQCSILKVNINHCRIQTIDADAFNTVRSMEKLNLNFNEIDNIDFLDNLSGSRFIELNYNKITTINSKNFMKLRDSLRYISIGFNNLLTIGSSTYQLNYLTELHLNNNHLSKIENNVLDGLPRLEILNFAYNDLRILEQKLLKELTKLKIIHLEGNQIKVITYGDVTHKNVNNNYYWGSFLSYEQKAYTELYLQNNPLSFGMNETDWNFNKLFKLDLSRCNVTVIKNVFGNLTSLEILKLADSSIEEISPNAFSSLPKLKELDLRNNKLTTLHENTFTGLKNLTKLYLSRNPIKVIFQSFSLFDNLFVLNITVQHFSITYNTFYGLKSVNTINFVNSSIVSINSGSFSNINIIETLRLENSTIQKIQPNGFKNLTFLHLSEINLENNFLTDIESNSFHDVKSISNIYLQNNLIENIHPGAFNGSTIVDSINLNNNNLLCILNDTFAGVTQLRKLVINNNKLIKIELDAFRVLDNLEELDLSDNNIKVLDNYTFSYLKELVLLNLTHNTLTTLYSNSFYNLVQLHTLDISNNNVNEFPLGTFNNVPNLISLNLEYNRISSFKTGSFSNLEKLASLDLSNNNLTILNELVLYPLHSLHYLDLSSNKLSFINATSVLLHLPKLDFIIINNNNWNCQLLTHLLKTFKSNHVNYSFFRTENYTSENVDGILCYENQNPSTEGSDITTVKTHDKENDIDLLREYLELLINNTKIERSKNFERSESQQPINSSNSIENVKIVNDNGTNVINVFILIVCLGIFLFQIFSLYKRYYSPAKSVAHQNDFSEMELLSTS